VKPPAGIPLDKVKADVDQIGLGYLCESVCKVGNIICKHARGDISSTDHRGDTFIEVASSNQNTSMWQVVRELDIEPLAERWGQSAVPQAQFDRRFSYMTEDVRSVCLDHLRPRQLLNF